MLYNPKWQKPEVKADPFSLESFISWLENQPAEIGYDWEDISGCVVCEYLRDVKDWDEPSEMVLFDRVFAPGTSEYDEVCGSAPWTFGAALDRARKALSQRDGGAGTP